MRQGVTVAGMDRNTGMDRNKAQMGAWCWSAVITELRAQKCRPGFRAAFFHVAVPDGTALFTGTSLLLDG
jgi:hypothetical protein